MQNFPSFDVTIEYVNFALTMLKLYAFFSYKVFDPGILASIG